MKRPREQDVQRALDVLARYLGTTITHGNDIADTLRVGGLEVALAIRPRNVVEQRDVEHLRRAALEDFQRWGNGGCAEYVQARSRGWYGSTTRACRQPVIAAVVRRSRTNPSEARPLFSFCCRTHLETESRDKHVLGVLKLSTAEVSHAKKERERRLELRAKGVIVPGDRPEVDTAIECALLTLAATIRVRRAA